LRVARILLGRALDDGQCPRRVAEVGDRATGIAEHDGIVLKNQGIGISAPAGTAVKTVESGVVEFAGAFPGYGLTVIVSHGGGYRTLYLYLKTIGVQVNQQVASGQVVGTVGGEQSAEGAHIEFQVRVPRDGSIEPVDPLAWLRARAGRS
jgi:septal ring factor EnvC (AmiA/AmiB activator)